MTVTNTFGDFEKGDSELACVKGPAQNGHLDLTTAKTVIQPQPDPCHPAFRCTKPQ